MARGGKTMKHDNTLIIAGLGYAGRAVAEAAAKAGWRVIGTSRQPQKLRAPAGVEVISFEKAGPAFAAASHWLITTPPDEGGDPVLSRHADALASGHQRWIGYRGSLARGAARRCRFGYLSRRWDLRAGACPLCRIARRRCAAGGEARP